MKQTSLPVLICFLLAGVIGLTLGCGEDPPKPNQKSVAKPKPVDPEAEAKRLAERAKRKERERLDEQLDEWAKSKTLQYFSVDRPALRIDGGILVKATPSDDGKRYDVRIALAYFDEEDKASALVTLVVATKKDDGNFSFEKAPSETNSNE